MVVWKGDHYLWWLKFDTPTTYMGLWDMTFSPADWHLTPKDLLQLERVIVDVSPYIPTTQRSHVPVPPLERGDGNLNTVGSLNPTFIGNSDHVVENRHIPEQFDTFPPTPSNSHLKSTLGTGTSIQIITIPQGGRFFRVSQLGALPAPTWLIDGVLPKDSLSMVSGPPKSLKSFLVLDWMLSLAVGRDWNGHEVDHAGTTVLYLLGEGKRNLFKRIEVWIKDKNLTPDERHRVEVNFLTSFVMPQVSFPKEVTTLLKDLNNEGFNPQLIVFDTFARSMVGREENSTKETGEAVAQMDRLREHGHTVMFIHHTVKNVSKKGAIYRGSGNLEAAIDTSFDVFRNRDAEELTVKNSNQKDDEEAEPMKFGWKKIFLDLDQQLSSLVLVPITDVPVADQIMAMALPLSRGDILKLVKGVRRETVVEILEQLLVDGKLTEIKQGRFKMVDKPHTDPNG